MIFSNISSVWKQSTSAFAVINVGGTPTWKAIISGFANIGGTWKEIYGSAITSSSQATISQSKNATTDIITLTGTNYSWTGPGPRVLTYKFQKSTDNSTWSDLTTYASITEPAAGSSNTKTYVLTQADIVANTTNYYRFTVHATYGSIIGDSTSTSTSVEAPRNITDLAASAVSGSTSSIDLSWTAPTGAGRIQVQYKRAVDTGWSTFGGVTGTSTSVRVTGLSTNTSYNFKLIPWTGSTGSTAGTYTGYYGNDSNNVTKSTNDVYKQGTGQINRVTLPSNFSSGTTMYISTNGFIGIGSDPSTSISIPSSGLYMSPLQGDMKQTALWTKSNTTGFYVRWQGQYLGDSAQTLDYQAIFYWDSTAVDVNFVTNNLTSITASNTAVQNGGTVTKTWSADSVAAVSTLLATSGMTRDTSQDGVDDNRTAITASKPVAVPANISTPTVSRDATSGYKYSTTSGSWTNSPTSYSYQWYYYKYVPYPPYNAGGIISGATSSSYTSSSTYVGYDIYCLVTATNSGGDSSPATSNYVTITTATSSWVSPGTPTSPLNTYNNFSGGTYNYTASWTAPTTGNTPFDYFVQVWGASSSGSNPGSGGTYVGQFPATTGGATSTTQTYSSSYPWNYFQVYARNNDGTSSYVGSNSISSSWD
jgi:hypothetical protein